MPPKQKSKSRLDTEQPVKAWEQGLQLAVLSEEVYFYVLLYCLQHLNAKKLLDFCCHCQDLSHCEEIY